MTRGTVEKRGRGRTIRRGIAGRPAAIRRRITSRRAGVSPSAGLTRDRPRPHRRLRGDRPTGRCSRPERPALRTIGVATVVGWPFQGRQNGPAQKECFLLFEIGVGPVRRSPASLCGTRLSPASTFKIPHALAALDAGVVSGPDDRFTWDGVPRAYESWRRDHTLASAMRNSVLWYFQRIAEKLGMARERDYLKRFDYGNADPSSGLTTFWLGESLIISPTSSCVFCSGCMRTICR